MLHIGSQVGMGGGFETKTFTDEEGDRFSFNFAYGFWQVGAAREKGFEDIAGMPAEEVCQFMNEGGEAFVCFQERVDSDGDGLFGFIKGDIAGVLKGEGFEADDYAVFLTAFDGVLQFGVDGSAGGLEGIEEEVREVFPFGIIEIIDIIDGAEAAQDDIGAGIRDDGTPQHCPVGPSFDEGEFGVLVKEDHRIKGGDSAGSGDKIHEFHKVFRTGEADAIVIEGVQHIDSVLEGFQFLLVVSGFHDSLLIMVT